MSGRVVAVLIESGVTVCKGDKVVVIEAMKMEHPIFAGSDGRLTIHCAVGDQVQTHQIVGVIGEENG